MGCSNSKVNVDRYNSSSTNIGNIEDITREKLMIKLRTYGVLEDMNLLFFIDKTGSTKWTGKNVFGGKCLHNYLYRETLFEKVFDTFGKITSKDLDGKFQMYDYGSVKANESSLCVDYLGECHNITELKNMYRYNIELVDDDEYGKVPAGLSGPTTIKPIIDEAIRVYVKTGKYHVVFILTDGSPHRDYKIIDLESLTTASKYPLSFVVIGLGDGEIIDINGSISDKNNYDFRFFSGLDDKDIYSMGFTNSQLTECNRKILNNEINLDVDNLQFVNFSKDICYGSEIDSDMKDKLYVKALMEVPSQYKYFTNKLKYRATTTPYVFPLDDINIDRRRRGLQEFYNDNGYGVGVNNISAVPQYPKFKVPPKTINV